MLLKVHLGGMQGEEQGGATVKEQFKKPNNPKHKLNSFQFCNARGGSQSYSLSGGGGIFTLPSSINKQQLTTPGPTDR